MIDDPRTYVFIGLSAMAAIAIIISAVRGHFEKRKRPG